MEYGKRYFRAYHNEHTINLIDIDMVNLNQWSDGRWKASGWHFVWHRGEFSDTPENALKALIDEVSQWVNLSGTLEPIPPEDQTSNYFTAISP